jgi:hypothetical protein
MLVPVFDMGHPFSRFRRTDADASLCCANNAAAFWHGVERSNPNLLLAVFHQDHGDEATQSPNSPRMLYSAGRRFPEPKYFAGHYSFSPYFAP